ncbi:hypothetical protein KXQ82_10350 [Mucilaginibacter sp. HMF5004]|uniref:hypothetical protein n=1 Tax=Mucilaginibacter rivuli TaxID=2857527 RepID=UPI001C5DDFA4|nr:hypothetical protein [Mucilaginibacter rivuli]MBW4890119.1 hypothetical protein [Mucilaginibacter rivuli]
MEVLNYTGRPIGIASAHGQPMIGLPSEGYAKCEIERIDKVNKFGLIPIYKRIMDRVNGLPSQDRNLEKLYIVNKEVAESIGHTRFDLLVVEEPIDITGSIYYKKLMNV